MTRFSSFADKEAQAALVYLTFKRLRRKLSTAAQYQSYLAEELFESCTNERLFKISRQNDPPFYTATVSLSAPSRLIPPTDRQPCAGGIVDPMLSWWSAHHIGPVRSLGQSLTDQDLFRIPR